MAKIAFRLNNVPEDEANQVRELLTEHNIEFYETNAGRWGISIAALWVSNDDDFEKARQFIEPFQQDFTKKMREQFEIDKREGRIPTFWQLINANPIMFITYWALIIAVLAITILPIYGFFN